jgi:hypothetical protein
MILPIRWGESTHLSGRVPPNHRDRSLQSGRGRVWAPYMDREAFVPTWPRPSMSFATGTSRSGRGPLSRRRVRQRSAPTGSTVLLALRAGAAALFHWFRTRDNGRLSRLTPAVAGFQRKRKTMGE